ncbi:MULTISPECIES: helix-turn-helix domain-containing protein [unclassified Phenylobacterium]|uniref:helix-turn-helix domain-containing protein n=1 Tax=unclassified Phenylobacterium TaxID=2640670 RepID=UPI000AB97D21|nr:MULTISPECIES: helix-turn-helix domain-containing protein [unclassified Phenylobacterium]
MQATDEGIAFGLEAPILTSLVSDRDEPTVAQGGLLAPFEAQVANSAQIQPCVQIGELTLCEIDARERHMLTERSMRHVAGRNLVGVGMILCGAGDLIARGRGVALKSGDLVLFEAGRPFELALQTGTSCLILTLPEVAIRRLALTMAEALPACSNGVAGPSLLLAATLRTLSEVARGMNAGGPAATALVAGVENLVLSTFTHLGEPRRTTANAGERLERIRAYVLAHLREPNLSVHQIANRLNISASTIHRAFSDQPCSAISWIWAMRLDGAQRDLCDPHQAHRNITDVAFGWGFNDTAHFSRAFRARFGCPPRQQRRECQARRGRPEPHAAIF